VGVPKAEWVRKDARARGDKYYMPLHPCVRGHLSKRLVKYGQCLECAKEHARLARQKRPSDHYLKFERPSKLKRLYGLTEEGYERLLKGQNSGCAICGSSDPGGRLYKRCRIKHFNVDHDHKNGKVRGLLCQKCNRALGLLDDSPERALKVAQYLRRA